MNVFHEISNSVRNRVQIALMKLAAMAGCVCLFITVAQGSSWDSSISSTYPGGYVTDIKTGFGWVFVTGSGDVYSWGGGPWTTFSDSTTFHVLSKKIVADSNYVYAFGKGTRADGDHYGLFRWDIYNAVWTQLGSDILPSIDANALALGPDNYIYFGGQWSGITLPNGQTANRVARYNLAYTNNTGWDNMLGGIPWANESDQSGVYSIATDSYSSDGILHTIAYIGGQFIFQNTNRNLVVYESSTQGQKYVPVTLGNGSSGLSGVGWYYQDCSNDENGVFVNTIVVAPSNGTNDVLIGGNFEPGVSCNSAGYQGLAKIIRNANQDKYNTVSWATLYSCDNTCNNCGYADIGVLSSGGTNRYLAGSFTKWSPFCASTVTSGANRFGEGTAAGAETFVSAEAFDINGSGSVISAISQGTSST